jgi:hypothetical protein
MLARQWVPDFMVDRRDLAAAHTRSGEATGAKAKALA